MLVAAVVVLVSVNLERSRVGRAFMAIRDREIAAASVGIDVARYKLLAFVTSSVITAVAGALFAYYRGFVSVEAFSFFLAVEYIAMRTRWYASIPTCRSTARLWWDAAS